MRQSLNISKPHNIQLRPHDMSFPPACISKNTTHCLVSQQRNTMQAAMANQAEAEADTGHRRTYGRMRQWPQ